MPKILVCYKWTLDEQDIKIDPADQSLDTSRAKYVISEYDKNAIEEATLMLENQGANVDVVTYGTDAVKQSLKDVLSRGPEQVFCISDAEAVKADAFVTANVLAAFVRKHGPYDLILCGDGSSDQYNQQVAGRLGTALNIPVITYANKIALEGSTLTVSRKLDDCTETVKTQCPALVSVLPEINKPRIPSLKQVLAAGKKPKTELTAADLGLSAEEKNPKTESISVKGFVMSRKNMIFKDSDASANVNQLVASLKSENLA